MAILEADRYVIVATDTDGFQSGVWDNTIALRQAIADAVFADGTVILAVGSGRFYRVSVKVDVEQIEQAALPDSAVRRAKHLHKNAWPTSKPYPGFPHD